MQCGLCVPLWPVTSGEWASTLELEVIHWVREKESGIIMILAIAWAKADLLGTPFCF